MKCPSCQYDNPSQARKCEVCEYPLDSSGPFEPTKVQTESAMSGDIPEGDLVHGRYLVVRQLGQGGMGEVYLVRDQKMGGREIALKLMSSSLVRDDQARQRFIKEVEASQSLRHENIVTVYHLDEVQGRDYFTLEYVPGKSLREL
ncbi:MAG: protein kinase, partial [Desulfohalobiaceae bacterium]